MTFPIEDYTIVLRFDPIVEYWIASIEEIPSCAGDGPSMESAIKALVETFNVLQEVYNEFGLEIAGPRNSSPNKYGLFKAEMNRMYSAAVDEQQVNSFLENLAQVVHWNSIAPWMRTPNKAFDGRTPIAVIEAGELDLLNGALETLRKGNPS